MGGLRYPPARTGIPHWPGHDWGTPKPGLGYPPPRKNMGPEAEVPPRKDMGPEAGYHPQERTWDQRSRKETWTWVPPTRVNRHTHVKT